MAKSKKKSEELECKHDPCAKPACECAPKAEKVEAPSEEPKQDGWVEIPRKLQKFQKGNN